jgi:hypothetical protein
LGVSELLLRDLDRHPEIVQERRVNMTELMPRQPTESRLFGGRLQHVAQQFRLAQRLPLRFPNTRSAGAVRVTRSRCDLTAATADDRAESSSPASVSLAAGSSPRTPIRALRAPSSRSGSHRRNVLVADALVGERGHLRTALAHREQVGIRATEWHERRS